MINLDLTSYGIHVEAVLRNAAPATLYEEAVKTDATAAITSSGALAIRSGRKTGRSPADKRIVREPGTEEDIWWGDINIGLDERTFDINRERTVDYLNTRKRLYVVDGFGGWDPNNRIKVRVICERAYHALFMHNMLIRPTAEELANFGEPDYVIYNAGAFPANRMTSHMTSKTSVDLSFVKREMVILGTEYAGEMKKGVFTIMHYIMPKKGILSMHCSANEGEDGDVSLFFGLSGTGKTTLSAAEELANFGDPDYVIYNAGAFPANRMTSHMTSKTSVDLSFTKREMVILGTEYAGEMKKGVFTIMHYIMPKKGILSMHCSANEGEDGDVSLFFGLSGTGKTTLSADTRRRLIGDDEHCWTDDGVFNIEGGCYAKAIDLSPEQEPEIYGAIRFGTVLENVVYDEETRDVDYSDTTVTQNTRAAYPIEFIPNAKIPCIGGHPHNIIFLTYDAFGLSGTGKTTLSADTRRRLIGDDEHCWTDDGVFNIEGGCYAKAIDLSPEQEPEIYGAIRFGTVLENVVYDEETRDVDYSDTTVTQNTRAAYPIEFIPNAKIPCIGGHPHNIIFLTYDAFGVMPPVSMLNPAQAMYHFISGYTAKVAGTEMGVDEPEATFSACFGAAFLVLHPSRYAEMLADRMRRHGARAWLVNTGFTGGAYGTGKRMSLKHTRAIIDAIHSGDLERAPKTADPTFGFEVPTECPGVPSEILVPRNTWADGDAYDRTAKRLSELFAKNFQKFEDGTSVEIIQAGPRLQSA